MRAGTAVAVPRAEPPRAHAHPAPVAVPLQRGRTGVFARLAVESVLDRVLRGRAWIWFVGLALGGIVFMQVWLLKLNTGISRAVQATTTLERQNSELEASIARLAAGERIRRVAGDRGMLLPLAGDVGYVTVRPGYDESRAVERIEPPTAEARELLAASRAAQATIGAGQALTGAVDALDPTATTAVEPAAGVVTATDPVTTTEAVTPTDPTATAATADPVATAAGTTTPAGTGVEG